MPELGSLGSVRGALSNGRPYREQRVRERHRRAETLLRLGAAPSARPRRGHAQMSAQDRNVTRRAK